MNLIPRNFLFDDDLEDFFVTKPSKRGEMKCDIYEKDNKYYIELDAPGFDKKDINIEVKDGYLTVKAHKKEESKDEKKNYIRKERYYGEYSRSFALGDVDIENIDAKFDKGLLTITIPKQEVVENKKKIEIKG